MAKHRQILDPVFADPAPANIKWSAIEAMLRWLKAEVTEGSGSRVRARLNGVKAVFHRPHPRPQASRSQVRAVRQFLENAGVQP